MNPFCVRVIADVVLGSCPLYTLFGVSTCSIDRHAKTTT